MNFDLVRPCPKCPFRRDIDGYLRGDRAREIAEVLARGGTFACHQTTVEAPEDDENFGGEMMEGPKSQMCAGSMIALMQSGGPNQIMRVAERVGGFDPDKLDRSKSKVGSLSDFVAHHAGEDEDEEECCSVVDSGCEHPAGIMMEGTILPSEEKEPTTPCEGCGEYVCENCSEEGDEGGRLCNACLENEQENEMVEEMQREQAIQGIDRVLKEVGKEREKQIEKWGTQDHDPHWWLAILTEENGEVAKEIAEARIGNWDAAKYREELVQVAAVAVAAIQCLDDGAA